MTDKTCNVLFLCTGNNAHATAGEACLQAMRYLSRRAEILFMLPIASLDEMSLRSRLKEIGREARHEPVETPLESAGLTAEPGWA
jgi:hypothetical protein